ncbi:MAG: DUF1667 domain-containing protein [Bacillota bacterium]
MDERTRALVCIECPQGCCLAAKQHGDEVKVTGNRCPRGLEYARRELVNPCRTLTTTVRTTFRDYPRLPVRTAGEIPLARVFEAMAAIRGVVVDRRVQSGEVIIPDLIGTGVALIATGDLSHQEEG